MFVLEGLVPAGITFQVCQHMGCNPAQAFTSPVMQWWPHAAFRGLAMMNTIAALQWDSNGGHVMQESKASSSAHATDKATQQKHITQLQVRMGMMT